MEALLRIIQEVHKRKTDIENQYHINKPHIPHIPHIPYIQTIPSVPNIDHLDIHSNTWIYDNIKVMNNNPYLRDNYKMIEMNTTQYKKKSKIIPIKYDKDEAKTNKDVNAIDIAFREANNGNDVYLLVYGDFRYPGGGVTTTENNYMPTTQEEQIFIRTNACKIFNDTTKIFNKYDRKEFNDLKEHIGQWGYLVNNTRHYFFKKDIMTQLTSGNVYLIKDVYMIRDSHGNLVNPSHYKPINLLYAVAPMYIRRHEIYGKEFSDEDKYGKLKKFATDKIVRYKTTVNNIFSLDLPTKQNKNILMFGNFGMGVYLNPYGSKLRESDSKPSNGIMGLFNKPNIIYVIDEYIKYINAQIHNTVYDTIYNIT